MIEEDTLREIIHVEFEERRNIETGVSDLEKDAFLLFELSEYTNSISAITVGILIKTNLKMLGAYFDKHRARGYFFQANSKSADYTDDLPAPTE